MVVVAPTTGSAYDEVTHRMLGERAALGSLRLDAVLRNDLGQRSGRDVLLTDGAHRLPAFRWIGEGAFEEDVPFFRSLNHFHDPTKSWSTAGLTLFSGESSVLWAQEPNQDPSGGRGGAWSWRDARGYFLEALTATQPSDREANLARTLRALGHLTHLVQDASVPAHVRNDMHPSIPLPLIGRRIPLNPDSYEDWVAAANQSDAPAVAPLLRADAPQPLASVFRPSGDGRAAVPVSGLIDTEPAPGAGVLRSVFDPRDVGISEFTNPNYFSGDTIFDKNYPLPRRGQLGQPFFELRDSKWRRYWPKVIEGSSAVEVSHFVAEGALYRSLSDLMPDPPGVAWTLDDRVHLDYAFDLVPRAIGYSAALVDYFFRGRLDVDLVDDGDPSRVRLVGNNASAEPLVDGALLLFADTADGSRQRLEPASGLLHEVIVRDIPAGGDLVSTAFHVDGPAERFVAVYEGTLGDERPDGTFPGAVIGKVLGGVRVEQIFAESGQWKVRTPKGVFTTGLTTLQYEVVKWGDGDDILAARTRFGDSQPNRFASYRVARRSGSVDFETTADSALALSDPITNVGFPFGMPAGTTVQFDATVRYQQRIGRFEAREIFDWSDADGKYLRLSWSADVPTLEVVKSETFAFSDRFSIALDTAHANGFSVPDDRRYSWSLVDFSADASGRLRALVRVTLGRPNVPSAKTRIMTLAPSTGIVEEDVNEVQIVASFGSDVNPLLWAVIDLESRDVLASTASSTVAVTADVADEAPPLAEPALVFTPVTIPGVWFHWLQVLNGGPFAGIWDQGWRAFGLSAIDPNRPDVRIKKTIDATTGYQALDVSGWLTPMAPALASTFAVAAVPSIRTMAYWEDMDGTINTATLTTHVGRVATSPPQLLSAQRVAAGSAGERVVFVAQGRSNGPGYVVVLDAKDRTAQTARLAGQLPAGSHLLRAATDAAAIVRSRVGDALTLQSAFVPFDTTRSPVIVPNVDLGASYTLLEPSYLYHPGDLRFYRVQSTPTRTAMPLPLAGSGPATGSFHTIRVP